MTRVDGDNGEAGHVLMRRKEFTSDTASKPEHDLRMKDVWACTNSMGQLKLLSKCTLAQTPRELSMRKRFS